MKRLTGTVTAPMTAGILLWALVSAAQAEFILGASSTLAGYYGPQSARLGDQPAEPLRAEPAYPHGQARYATLRLGTGADPLFTVAVSRDEDGCAVYVDANNDEDLTNDGDGTWQQSTPTAWSTTVGLQVPYASPAGERTLQYQVVLYCFKERNEDAISYYRDTAAKTVLRLDDKEYAAALLDDNCDGRFDDLAATAILIDVDGDGEFYPGRASHEYYRPRELFNLGGKCYWLTAAAADGSGVTAAPPWVPAKADLRPGKPAVAFQGVDTQGKPVSLADYRGKVVLLDFWASWCVPCKEEMPNVVAVYQQYHEQGLEIIGISLDESLDDLQAYLAEQPAMSWRQICDEQGWEAELAQLYRVYSVPASFLIGRDGTIQEVNPRGERLGEAVGAAVGG